MVMYAAKPKFQAFLQPFARLLVSWRIHPTAINIAALIVSIVIGVALFFADQFPVLFLFVPILAFKRTALNVLDGMVARARKIKTTAYGEVLNEFTDRLSDTVIFFCFALASYTNLILGLAVLTAILLNSYLGILSKAAGGSRQYGGFMGRTDRMVYLALAAVVMFVTGNVGLADFFLWFVLIGTLLTLFQRFIATAQELL